MRVNKVRASRETLLDARAGEWKGAWADPNDDDKIVDTNVFPDGAALLFPMTSDAPLQTMGSKTQPVYGSVAST